jgi:hypothetical protein
MARLDRAIWRQTGTGALAVTLMLGLSGCATLSSLNPFGGNDTEAAAARTTTVAGAEPREETIWDLFASRGDAANSIRVNRYIWNAALDVLAFLPVETVDPFSGVIVTGFGTPPGGTRAYRATVLVSDPALDARALRVALIGRDGQQVDPATLRALEDAILTRAREMRTRDARL